MFDGQYMGQMEQNYSSLRNVNAKTRYNLLRENDNMEEDEWRDKVNNLKEICEYYKEMALNDEPSNDSFAGSDNY